jgi:ABC-type phosphate transport system substrate-binding protein
MDGVRSATGVRIVPIGEGPNAEVSPSEQSLADGVYPLRRTLYAYFNLPAGGQMQPALRAFLIYVLSESGQALIRANGYLQLTRTEAHGSTEVLK